MRNAQPNNGFQKSLVSKPLACAASHSPLWMKPVNEKRVAIKVAMGMTRIDQYGTSSHRYCTMIQRDALLLSRMLILSNMSPRKMSSEKSASPEKKGKKKRL